MADQLDDKLMIGFSVVRTGHPDQKRGHFTVPLYAAATQARPQASAEDVELIGLAIKEHAARYPGCETENAWQRIRADWEVGK